MSVVFKSHSFCISFTDFYIVVDKNNVTEPYSLLKFFHIKPLSNRETFNVQIAKPDNSGLGAGRAMKRL